VDDEAGLADDGGGGNEQVKIMCSEDDDKMTRINTRPISVGPMMCGKTVVLFPISSALTGYGKHPFYDEALQPRLLNDPHEFHILFGNYRI
jgi:hypothetical protein